MPKKTSEKKNAKKSKGGFILVAGWTWQFIDGRSVLKFGPGVEIVELRNKPGSNELSLKLFSKKFDEGEAKLNWNSAKVKYSFLAG